MSSFTPNQNVMQGTKTVITSVSYDNANNSGWQAHHLCLLAPSAPMRRTQMTQTGNLKPKTLRWREVECGWASERYCLVSSGSSICSSASIPLILSSVPVSGRATFEARMWEWISLVVVLPLLGGATAIQKALTQAVSHGKTLFVVQTTHSARLVLFFFFSQCVTFVLNTVESNPQWKCKMKNVTIKWLCVRGSGLQPVISTPTSDPRP